MTSPTFEELLRSVEDRNGDRQEQAAYALARSPDPRAIATVAGLLLRPEDFADSAVVWRLLDGLIDGAPATIGPLIDFLRGSPIDRAFRDLTYALGEIAYKQPGSLDPRIVPFAIELFDRGLPDHLDVLEAAIYIFRQAVWRSKQPEASPRMRRFVQLAREGVVTRVSYAPYAFDVLVVNEGPAVLDELRRVRDELPPAHPLHEEIDLYLTEKAKGAVFS